MRAVRELDPPTGAVRGREPTTTRLAAHVFALGVVLVLVMSWIGPGRFTIDETAYRQQAEVLRTGAWELDYPEQADGVVVPAVAPLALSQTFTSGWTPYSRHPLYPELLSRSWPISATYGPVLWSIVGTLLAAAGTGRLRQWFDGGSPAPAVWGMGLLSPLAIHSQILWAHSLTVGLTAVAMALGFEAVARSQPWLPAALMASGTLAVSVFLRTEAPFAVAALVVAMSAVPGVDFRRWLSVGALVAVAGAAALVVDQRWAASIPAGERDRLPASDVDTSVLAERLDGVSSLLVNVGGTGLASISWLLAPILLTAAWIKHRAETPDRVLVTVLASLSVAAALLASTSTEALSGWLPATPLLGVALGHGLVDRRARPLMLFVAVVVAGVVATVPAGAGGLGWGGRYVLATTPAVVVLAVVALERLRPAVVGRILVAAGLAITLLVQLNGVRVLDRNHDAGRAVEAALDEELRALAAEGRPIVAPDIRIGRTAPEAAIDIGLLSPSDIGHLPHVLDHLASIGVGRVTLVELEDHPVVQVPADWQVVQTGDEGLLRQRTVQWQGETP